MIRAEDVADLREGDVVELTFASGSVIRGPLTENRHCGELSIADVGWTVRDEDGAMGYGLERYAETLTVVSRAPRPLYVNHPRTEPAEDDIVRDCDGDAWRYERDEWWCASVESCDEDDPDGYPIDHYRPLTLLWDGTTGEVVP